MVEKIETKQDNLLVNTDNQYTICYTLWQKDG